MVDSQDKTVSTSEKSCYLAEDRLTLWTCLETSEAKSLP
jgi:hypothetical protein